MKKIRSFVIGALVLMLIGCCKTGVFAKAENIPVSPALAVISASREMSVLGRCGQSVSFEKRDFTDSLGVRELGHIDVLSLPEPTAGKLMLGSLEVMKNQRISMDNISSLRFVPSDGAEIRASFVFRAGNEQKHEMRCNINIIEGYNFAPTVSKSVSSATQRTYRNISYFGKMSADDPEGDALTFEISSYPVRGLLTVLDRSGGEYIYTPTSNYSGNDSFEYYAVDSYGNRSETVKVKMTSVRSSSDTVFADLMGKAGHNEAIYMSDIGAMEGKMSSGKLMFDPEGAVSRAEFLKAAMLAMGEEIDTDADYISVFADDGSIDPEHRPYILSAYGSGILTSLIDKTGKLEPDRNITLADACAVLSDIMYDGNDDTEAGNSSISVMAGAGITELGVEDADKPLTRGDVAKMLYRAKDKK